jgi:hypothetical protein
MIEVIMSRMMGLVGHKTCTGDIRNVHKIFVRKPSELKQLDGWKDNINMVLREIGCEDVNGLNWVRICCFCEHGDEPG